MPYNFHETDYFPQIVHVGKFIPKHRPIFIQPLHLDRDDENPADDNFQIILFKCSTNLLRSPLLQIILCDSIDDKSLASIMARRRVVDMGLSKPMMTH